MSEEIVITGRWENKELDSLIHKSWMIHTPDEQIAFLSKHFLGIPYQAHTLIGSRDNQEVFVINLGAVDCLTFIEYIEAMRLSNSFSAFKINLRRIRYQGAVVDYRTRNHFFTDWVEYNSDFVEDATNQAGGSKTIAEKKLLNLKDDGTFFLYGIEPRLREIRYIPSAFIDDKIIARLNTGDYIGIYTEKTGLDASHVGILIKNASQAVFRHASSRYKKVIEQDLKQYITGKPGIVVLRTHQIFDKPE
jgi:hypothetical protein